MTDLDTIDLTRARAFARARRWIVCPKPFSWRILADGERIDIWDHEPELPPHCSRPVFFRRHDGRVTAILAQRVRPDDHAACQDFAQAHGLTVETPEEWPGAVLWTRCPIAIRREEAARTEARWREMGREALRRTL
ncbi:hypothetical protein WOC76_04245 [Methylocystis sp. IM3]|uniref:hypothetical protein n=1 Tax=unclassified Methylocystis TaxID=2625913 RepID=UPI0030F89D97